MTDEPASTVEAVHVAAEIAAQTSKDIAEQAEKMAQTIVAANKINDERVTRSLSDALRDVFGEHASSGRFVDVSRIPLLCKSILDTNERIKDIVDRLDNKYVTNEAFSPVKTIVYGLVGAVLLAVVSALLYMVVAYPGRTTVTQIQATPTSVVK